MRMKPPHSLFATFGTRIFMALVAVSALLQAPPAAAIEFDEVRDYDEVFVISAAAPARDRIEVSWSIEDGYYLYNNRFLQFSSEEGNNR